ncbi:VacJ family lipoprotein [Roseateles sp.]|uniref:MlaA family lipoprotein n=1 Tax=Roseateles sp. TaxID=1971397 RepID=UPI0031D78A16
MTTTTTAGARVPSDLAAALLSAALLGASLPALAQAGQALEQDLVRVDAAVSAVETAIVRAAGEGGELREARESADGEQAAAAAEDQASPPASAASAAEPAAAGQAGAAAAAADETPAPGPRVRNRLDPWENWNRKVFNFNEKLDEHVLRPVATAYSDLVPQPARQAVDNFFGNFSDAWSAINLFLQGRFKNGATQTMRVAVNSVFGIAGLIDIATPAGLEKTSEDLGRTLGYWGVKTGPYIVWPLLGPSSLRDSVTLPVNVYYSPAYLFDDGEYKFAITALQVINTRANLLRVTDMLDGIALDKYTFVRDAYLQRRNVKTHKEQEEEDDYEVISPDEKPVNPQSDR